MGNNYSSPEISNSNSHQHQLANDQERIRAFLKHHAFTVQELDLSDHELTYIPSEVSQLTFKYMCV